MEGDDKRNIEYTNFFLSQKVKVQAYKLKDQLSLKIFPFFQLDSLSGICSDLCHFSPCAEYKAC